MNTISIEFTREELERFIYYFKDSTLYIDIKERMQKAIEQLDAPQIGDRCVFKMAGRPDENIIGKLVGDGKDLSGNIYYKCMFSDEYFTYCAKIKKEAEFKA